MDIEEHLLAASIRNTISEADAALIKYYDVSLGNTSDNVDEGDHADALEEAQTYLAFLIEKVFRDTGILAERLGLPAYRKDVMSKLHSFDDLTSAGPTRWDVGFHSPPLAAARSLFASLSSMTEGREVTGLGVLETVLSNTGKIVEDDPNLTPSKETQVRDAVHSILRYGFRDAVVEASIVKNLKTYRPDIAIRSLMSAIEYKFCDTKEKAKAALDGIYADMHGYSGHPEFRNFYAVLYLTSNFYTQADVEREFALANADRRWKPIIVYGLSAPKLAVAKPAKVASAGKPMGEAPSRKV